MIPQRFVLQQPPRACSYRRAGTSTVSESFIVSPPVATLYSRNLPPRANGRNGDLTTAGKGHATEFA